MFTLSTAINHKRPKLLWSILLVMVVLLSGCETLVKTTLLTAKSYPNNLSNTQNMMKEFDVQVREHCDPKFGCYEYLFAPSKSASKKFDMNIETQFTRTPHTSSLQLKRADIVPFTGSVVIVHGFRASKEWMLVSAAYFQFLGFDVYLLDLLGHGSSTAAKGFGVSDSQYVQNFISQKLNTTLPIIAVGNSMGGLVAATLGKNKVVDAVILQAPMTQFDDSLLGYFKDTKPWYDFLLSDAHKSNGANAALRAAGLSVEQTNTLPVISASEIPYLIFASNTDSVSPYLKFAPLKSSQINVLEINNREHAYMSMIGEQEHSHIVDWLNNTVFLRHEQ